MLIQNSDGSAVEMDPNNPLERPGINAWRATLNTSGVQPIDLRVVVKPDPVQERIGSIILAPETTDKERFAVQKGTLVAVGENAWEEAAARSASFRSPQAGDRVMIGKYAGTRFKGADGEDYVLMNDQDVIGRLAE